MRCRCCATIRSDVIALRCIVQPRFDLDEANGRRIRIQLQQQWHRHVVHWCARDRRAFRRRLLIRFGDRWRILLNCLVFFGFIYPAERARIPIRVMRLLLERLNSELETDMEVGRVCRGPLVSREQYLPDTLQWGYTDGRIAPLGSMTPEQVKHWTGAIGT